MMRPGPRVSRTRISRRGSAGAQALTLVVGLVIAASVLGAGLIRGVSGPTVVPVATQDGRDYATCLPVTAPGCRLAPAGAGWTLRPVSTWCTSATSSGQTSNGTFQSTAESCGQSAVGFDFGSTTDLSLTGNVSATGPFQVWVFPTGDSCGWYTALSWADLPGCREPPGPLPNYPLWNVTKASAGSVDLANLTFNFGGGIGVLPPTHWNIDVVDIGAMGETVRAGSAVVVNPI
jgi:hypothetical protein